MSGAYNAFEDCGMKETDALQPVTPDGVSSALKVLLFATAPTLIGKLFPHGHWVLFGASFIIGALLQTLIPPRAYRLRLILGISAAAAVVIPVVAYLARWN